MIPATRLGRDYADELGRVNQQFAAAADDVIVMFAGLPVSLKARRPSRTDEDVRRVACAEPAASRVALRLGSHELHGV